MQKLIALTALYILGQWLQPGAEVPGDVPGFDYAKAYRKGMLEAEDGSEVENPLPPGQTPAASPEPSSDEASLRTQATQLTRERDEAKRQAATLKTDAQVAQDALKPWAGLDPEQVKSDLSALAEYREVLGELLPTTFPGRAKLFTQGYYTTAMLDGVEKADLVALEGIGEATADQILKALPASAAAPQG